MHVSLPACGLDSLVMMDEMLCHNYRIVLLAADAQKGSDEGRAI